jgi:hypothetical protein
MSTSPGHIERADQKSLKRWEPSEGLSSSLPQIVVLSLPIPHTRTLSFPRTSMKSSQSSRRSGSTRGSDLGSRERTQRAQRLARLRGPIEAVLLARRRAEPRRVVG